jgi:uncharacterized protein YdhG (YjbR/CyaY superfamily)
MKQYRTINEYIAASPRSVRAMLRELRSVLRKAVPQAEEAIRYGMPTLRLNGNLVHFAAFKNHIGFFPTPSGVRAFAMELSKYETSKGTVRFPLDTKLPFPLIRKIVLFRVREQLNKRS